jgi:hypothetical protein
MNEQPAPEVVESLNQAFYSAEPHLYLIQRLVNLIVVKDKGEQLEDLVEDEFRLGEQTLKRQSVLTGKDRRWRFLMTESEVVLHHVSETALRLYLAHAATPQIPWIAVAQEFDFRKFKKDVEELGQRLKTGGERDLIHLVFHGTDSAHDLGPEPPLPETRDAAADNIADYLALFARIFLDAAPYNAAKHGLAVAAGRSRLQVEVDGEEVMTASGTTLDCLVREWDDGRAQWTIETRWLEPDYAISLGIAGCHLIQLLWLVGRARYLDEPVKLDYLFDKPSPRELQAGFEDPRWRKMTRRFKNLDE